MAACKSSRASRKYETIYGPTSSAISMTRPKKPSRLTADVTPLAETKAGSIDTLLGTPKRSIFRSTSWITCGPCGDVEYLISKE